MNIDNNELWGGLFGFVVGLVVAKVYQSWAILYRLEGSVFSGDTGWRDGLLSTPLYIRATDHSLGFTIVVILVFITVGVQFAKYLTKIHKI
ncbi:hypothetical protein ACFYKX_19270 [Cytobacillus sp. FJAT-54145]|uniref:DUF4321 domain-containing protein n=1 Tax=Cytobacillus spartinae TaxID=3299023 RepID=A0ABW6KEZ4_9BACI